MLYHRDYRNELDYTQMRQLLIATYASHGPPTYCTLGDLDWWRGLDDDPKAIYQTHLWFDNEQLVAFAWPSAEQVDIVIHPAYVVLTSELVVWATNLAAFDTSLSTPAKRTLWAFTRDQARTQALERVGYQRTDAFFAYLTRSLDSLPKRAPLPTSYTIRPVQTAMDVAARAVVQRAAFGSTTMTEAKYHAITQLPTYQPDLDLVVVTADEQFAAFATIWLDAANQFGTFEPVGTHPDFQRQGLAGALLAEGLRRLRDRGAQLAHVNAFGDTSAGAQLYQSLGFAEVDRNYAWAQPAA